MNDRPQGDLAAFCQHIEKLDVDLLIERFTLLVMTDISTSRK
jgi:hypothetical protein